MARLDNLVTCGVFALSVGLPAACPAPGAADAASTDAADGGGMVQRRLVVVTLNAHGFQQGATSVDDLRAIGAGFAVLGVDVVVLNEVMSGSFWSYDFGGAQYDGMALI